MYKPVTASAAFLLTATSEVLAQAPAGAPANQPFGEVFFRMMPMFIVVFFIFYFLIMKPQQAKLKAQAQMMANLKAGDVVVTTGGIFGRVAKSEKDYVLIEVATNVKIKIEANHIAKKIEKESSEKEKEK